MSLDNLFLLEGKDIDPLIILISCILFDNYIKPQNPII